MRSRLGYWSPQEHLQMATRSRIGLLLSDGSVLSAYSHWDGYPSGVGKILKEHYNSFEKISELIDGGDMSHPYTEYTWTDAKRSPQPQYYSERGEDCPPRLDYSMNQYLMDHSCGEEFVYLWKDDQWLCYDVVPYHEEYMHQVAI